MRQPAAPPPRRPPPDTSDQRLIALGLMLIGIVLVGAMLLSINAPAFAPWFGLRADDTPASGVTTVMIYQEAKTLWDWLQLLLVPLVLVLGGFWLTRMENRAAQALQHQREQAARWAEQRYAATQAAIAEERRKETERLEEQRRTEADRIEEQRRKETERIEDERRKENARIEEERRKEADRIEEERRKENVRIAEERAQDAVMLPVCQTTNLPYRTPIMPPLSDAVN